MSTTEERLAVIETKLVAGDEKFDRIEAKLDDLVLAHSKQKGFIAGVSTAFSLLGTALAALIAYIWKQTVGGQ